MVSVTVTRHTLTKAWLDGRSFTSVQRLPCNLVLTLAFFFSFLFRLLSRSPYIVLSLYHSLYTVPNEPPKHIKAHPLSSKTIKVTWKVRQNHPRVLVICFLGVCVCNARSMSLNIYVLSRWQCSYVRMHSS